MNRDENDFEWETPPQLPPIRTSEFIRLTRWKNWLIREARSRGIGSSRRVIRRRIIKHHGGDFLAFARHHGLPMTGGSLPKFPLKDETRNL